MRRLLPRTLGTLLALLVAAALPSAAALSLAVYPFDSDDPLLGAAVADEVAAAFGATELVLGPDIAVGATPPIMVTDGFIGISRLVGGDQLYGPAGADLLRTGLGVDVAATGRVLVMDDTYRLELVVAGPTGATLATVEAPHGRRDLLVARAARVVAQSVRPVADTTPPPSPPIEGGYAAYLTALLYASTGLVGEARSVLAGVPPGERPARAEAFEEDLEAASDLAGAGRVASASRQLRRALLAMGVESFDAEADYRAFADLASSAQLPLADAWAAVLAVSLGDLDAASVRLEAAQGRDYPYVEALAASFTWLQGDEEGALRRVAEVAAGGQASGSAALLGASVVAQVARAPLEERAALEALTRAAPFLPYPLERLSFLAFDRDDALGAAEALAVAVELDPESDLYWTNLGWAYYLLGFLERSESASLRAAALDANQYIALYNLGLVRTVTGRLQEAVSSYDAAIRLDPGVDPEAIKDLERAVDAYPGEPAVRYALGYLYDAAGRREDARAELRRFVRLASAAGAYPDFVAAAASRLVVLEAPPPPLELLGGVVPRLGKRGPQAQPFHPGDRLVPAFEVSTPGEQLPTKLGVELALVDADGETGARSSREVIVPTGAVGYVVDDVALDLPFDLAAGDYVVSVTVTGLDGTRAEGVAEVAVEGAAVPLRWLLSRGVVMTSLSAGAPLYAQQDLIRPEGLVDKLLSELRSGVSAAEEALPAITLGRFAGLSGGELFSRSTAQDVEDYLGYLAASGIEEYRFVFVDSYAQWALDGAPVGRAPQAP